MEEMASELTSDGRSTVQLVDVHVVEAAHALSSYGNLMLCISAGPPTPSLMRRTAEHARSTFARHPEGVGVAVVLDVNCPPPDDDGRRAVQETYPVLRPMVRGIIYIVEGEGFAAAAKRSVLSLVNMTIRAGFPIKVAGTLEEGIPWLKTTMGSAWPGPVRVQHVIDATNSLRPRLARK